MEIENDKSNIQENTDMPLEKCSFQYIKKRKNPYSDIHNPKPRPYLINNSLKNIIESRKINK